jgi:hypothetical protein
MDALSAEITMIVNALTTGAMEAGKETAAQSVKDAYSALKAITLRKLRSAPNVEDVEAAIRAVEKRPDNETRREVLAEELSTAHADRDSELLKMSQSLLDVVNKFASSAGAAVDAGGQIVQGSGSVVIGANTSSINMYNQVQGVSTGGDKAFGGKIREQINTGGGTYSGDNVAGETPTSTTDVLKLTDLLNDYFSEGDLEDVCFRMGIEWENLRGETRNAKARSLVQYCQRLDIVPRLKDIMRAMRPNLRSQLA